VSSWKLNVNLKIKFDAPSDTFCVLFDTRPIYDVNTFHSLTQYMSGIDRDLLYPRNKIIYIELLIEILIITRSEKIQFPWLFATVSTGIYFTRPEIVQILCVWMCRLAGCLFGRIGLKYVGSMNLDLEVCIWYKEVICYTYDATIRMPGTFLSFRSTITALPFYNLSFFPLASFWIEFVTSVYSPDVWSRKRCV
jgi:hypothetical protein